MPDYVNKEVPITVCVSASLEIRDKAALDLTRGEAYYGRPFEDEEELLDHLAVNLIGAGHSLRDLDGWADLSNDAVRVRINDTESIVHKELMR